MVNIPPLQMMPTMWSFSPILPYRSAIRAQTGDRGLVFQARMLHENAALAADSPPGYAKTSIDWYSFAQ